MQQNIYLIIFLFGKLYGQDKFHEGVYSGSIARYEVVIPKVLKIQKERTYSEESHHLNKRQVQQLDHRIRMELKFEGKNQVLDLWRSTDFIANHIHVQRFGNLGESKPRPSTRNCHFRGIVEGQNGSTVAMSTCNGMVGFIQSRKGRYWLEPSKRASDSGEKVHLLFKRSAIKEPRTLQKKKKKRKKHDKNCGTRENRHMVGEARLQWSRKKGSKVKVQGRERRGRVKRPKLKNNKEMHNQRHLRQRLRRSMSTKRHVECLVVADSSMLEFYQGEDVEAYLLTIMNMVNVMYHDSSIGNYINIVVVRIVLLEDDAVQGLNVTVNADATLDSFCRWQRNMNHLDDSHPLHHDVALLVTRQDICSGDDKPCGTLGVAHVSGMCQPDRSCSVNEDNGVTLAHTIAHELGHNFGMYHDTPKSGCPGRDGSTLHVMTTSFEADTLNVAWSPCSRKDITHFFDGGLGSCLEDEPTSVTSLSYPELPIGAMYNAEYQCKIQFAVENTSVCTPIDEVCSRLWCIVDGVCTTMLHPAAPGTNCGKHKWCEQQSCVGIGDTVDAVDGGWGPWTDWRPCSRSCGAGVSTQERFCDHPVPSNGGSYCLGERTRYRICNNQECKPPAVSFRAEQCSSYNNKITNSGMNVSWLSYFDTTEPCQLFCTDEDDTIIMPMGFEALDGTPCNLGKNDMCIAGLCRKVGCDWVVESDMVEDRCGNCNGDGNQCNTYESYYNKSHGLGYVKLVTIPKKARNIIVEELGHSRNYIGVGSAVNKNFYLNGDKAITLPGEYAVAESQALYKRDKEKESLHILGPIQEEIIIYLIFQDGHKNPGVRYEYTMPKQIKHPTENKRYVWHQNANDWTACSATCGKGEQQLVAVCKESTNHNSVVDDALCDANQKPEIVVRSCSLQPCAHKWWTGPWQVCPVTCGDIALRRRTVLCVTEDEEHRIALPDSTCADQPKPKRSEPCVALPPCLFPSLAPKSRKHLDAPNGRLNFQGSSKNGWLTMPWSRCSRSCGLGFKKRTVYCAKPDVGCKLKNRPIDVKQCYKKCF